MKKLTAVAFVVASLGLAGNASAALMIQDHTEASLVKICDALKSNSKHKLSRAIKKSGYTYKTIASGLVCNGEDAMTFALNNEASNTANLLARKANINADALVAKR